MIAVIFVWAKLYHPLSSSAGVLEDIEELAPNSWTINFVNPTAVIGIALMRYTPNIRSFAICDGLHEPYYRLRYLKQLGIVSEDAEGIPPNVERDLTLHSIGVNHFTWLTKLEYKGKNLMPEWRKPGLVLDRKYKYRNFQCQTFHSIHAEFITV